MALPSGAAGGLDRFAGLVLVRIAAAADGIARGAIAADLATLAGRRPSAPQWRAAVERAVAALTAAGLVVEGTVGLGATRPGLAEAAAFLGAAGSLPHAWRQVCDGWLIAKALGWPQVPARRLATLGTPEGLRAAILAHAYGLEIKGVATPARLRRALAAAALARAFGDADRLVGRLGLSARGSRLLAAQLMSRPRDFGTDTRLVAALAAEAVGAAAADLAALRLAILRRFVEAAGPPARAKRDRRKHPHRAVDRQPPPPAPPAPQDPPAPPRNALPAALHLLPPTPDAAPPPAPPAAAPPVQAQPFDLSRFALEVRRCAASEAQGWSGDRKAYISRVWRSVRDTRPEWGLSETEFKLLLAEAHRSGQLALANADLKDASNIKDVQESAVVYRNAVFHFIRVDA